MQKQAILWGPSIPLSLTQAAATLFMRLAAKEPNLAVLSLLPLGAPSSPEAKHGQSFLDPGFCILLSLKDSENLVSLSLLNKAITPALVMLSL